MTSCAERKDFCVRAGATFNPIIRWGSSALKAAAITAISQGTPVTVTAPGHGIPNGWPVAIVGVNGMNGINATRYPPVESDWHDAVVVDANTLSLNDISTALLAAYISGGSVVFNTPLSLVGATATMTLWANPERIGTPLVVLTNALGGNGITLDSNAFTIIPFLQTAGLAWPSNVAYYDLDVTDASGVVTNLFVGTFTIQ